MKSGISVTHAENVSDVLVTLKSTNGHIRMKSHTSAKYVINVLVIPVMFRDICILIQMKTNYLKVNSANIMLLKHNLVSNTDAGIQVKPYIGVV